MSIYNLRIRKNKINSEDQIWSPPALLLCIYYISPPAAIDGSWRQLYLLCIVYRRQQLLMAAGGDCIYLYVIMAGHHCILDVVSSHFLICISTSYQPSTQLSRKPTSQPFARPSRQPSGQPSVRPSTICKWPSQRLCSHGYSHRMY